jgi:hypothetical protein
MKRIQLLLLFLVLILGFYLRLYRFNNPIGDWHAFRQADTSAVSKVYVENGVNLLYPKYFDISNIQSGRDNQEGYRFVEFPLFNLFQSVLFLSSNILTLEEWGRLVSVISSALSALFIFLIVRKHLNFLSAIFASFFFSVLPFSIYYGRTILPDPSTAMAILGGIYFFDLWLSGKSIKYRVLNVEFILAVIFTASAFLLKPFALFFTLPMLILALEELGIKLFKKWQFYLFAMLSILPLVLWRIWITHYPEGIPVSSWLFNEGNVRFTGSFFYWIFAERIGKLILGYFGVALLLLGFFKQKEKSYGFFVSFAVSSIIYLSVVARGNVQHDYYQILILPTICIFLGRGASFLLSIPSKTANLSTNTIISLSSVIIVIIFSISFSWFYVRDYFNINNRGLITAGQIADKVLPKDAKVIAANEGDTSFLYYINRKGWPAYQKAPLELKEMGADFIVIPTPNENDYKGLGVEFEKFYSSPEVLILKL